jgi:hypothetical protein
MVKRLTLWPRVLFALAFAGLGLAAALLAAGFALSSVWPAVSWALGSALALVILLVAWSWLRAAVTGQRGQQEERAPEKGGAI